MNEPIDIDTTMNNGCNEPSSPFVGRQRETAGETSPTITAGRLSVDEVMWRVRAEVVRRQGEIGQSAERDLAPDCLDEKATGYPTEHSTEYGLSRNGPQPLSQGKTGVSPQEIPAFGRWQPSPSPLAVKQAYVLADLIPFNGVHFVTTVFTALLHRDPLPAERSHYLDSLRTGFMSKIEVLADIRWSQEGRSHDVHIDGLLAPYLVQRAQRWPVIGPIFAWVLALARLPAMRRRMDTIEASLGQETQQLGSQLNAILQTVESSLESIVAQGEAHSAELQTAIARMEAGARDLSQLHRALSLQKMELTTLYRRVVAGADQSTELEEKFRLYMAHDAERGKRLESAIDQLSFGMAELNSRPEGSLSAYLDENTERRSSIESTIDQLGLDMSELNCRTEGKLSAYLNEDAERRARMEGAIDEIRSGVAIGVQALSVRLGEEVANLASRVNGESEQRRSMENTLGELRLGLEAGVQSVTSLMEGAVETLNARIDNEAQHAEHIAALQSRLPEINDQLIQVITTAQSLRAGVDHVESALADKADVEQVTTVVRQLAGQRSAAVELQRRFGALLEEARSRLPEKMDAEQLQRFAAEELHRFDGMYASFEDQFRGSRDNIRSRARHYIDVVKSAGAGSSQAPVLDLGCGRGEWLELLRDEGLAARGVDLNDVFLAQCRNRGLDVIQSDALAYLRELPDASLGAITSMHLVEHLPMSDLINLLDESARVLRPGGVIALETPNPENLLVGSHYFYMDPTHRNPLPPALLQWLVEARGFEQARVDRLSEHRGEPALLPVAHDVPGAVQINAFVALLNHAPDYAVIASKPFQAADDKAPNRKKKRGSKR